MIFNNAFIDGEVRRVEENLLDFVATRGFQDVEVVLPETPGTPFDVPHNLSTKNIYGVRWEVLQMRFPVVVYHGQGDAWSPGLLRLRATNGGGTIRLRLTVDESVATELPDAEDPTAESLSAPASVAAISTGDGEYIAKLTTEGPNDRNGVSLVAGAGPAVVLDPGGADNSWAIQADVTEGSANPRLLIGAGARDSVAWAMALHPDASNTADKWWLVPAVGGELNLGAATGDGFGNNLPINRIRTTDIHSANGYYERSRSALMGEWTAHPFNAADFTAAGAGTWTVQSGDVQTYSYSVVGKTMFLVFEIVSTTVARSGADPIYLQAPIPGGYTCAFSTRNSCRIFDNGVFAHGMCFVQNGATTMQIYRQDLAQYQNATNATQVLGQIIIPLV